MSRAARHDGGVRGLAADIGHEAGEHALFELQHVGGRQVVRHQHQGHIGVAQLQFLLGPLGPFGLRHQGARAFQAVQHPLAHLLHVGFAFTQVRVLHLLELAHDDVELIGQGPLGVVQACLDPVHHARRQLFVLQQHQVHVQQSHQLVWGVLGHAFLQAL